MKLSTLSGSIVVAALVLLSGIVSAGTINTFQFVDNGANWTTYGTNSPATLGTGPGSNLGLSARFEGSKGLSTTVTFLEGVADNGSGGTAVQGFWEHGLTVIGNDGFNSRVDNDGEALLFDFGTNVKALSSFFYGWGRSSDVRAFYKNGSSWSTIATVNNFSGFFSLSLNDIVSDQFLFVNIDTGINDSWAFKGLAVETIDSVVVPEPGTLLLLGAGLIGLGFNRRQQRNRKISVLGSSYT